ncbi:MAG: hypothetical protein KAH56_05040 [Candidatus Krumholzibacteria bacterium]|nr:hypothetical protein [Candidatus Krumholzibacteria bacterium]
MTVVVVSWVLVLLAVFGVNYSHDVIAESRLIQLEVQQHQLRAWATSGVELARVTLGNTPRIECATLGYSGPENLFAFPLACGQGRFAVGGAYAVDDQEHWLPGIGDEAGRLPMALVDSTALAVLPGMTSYGRAVLLDAKEAAGSNRLPPFELIVDLDEASRECANRFLSRYGNAVNLNTASEEVMFAVGLPPRGVHKLLGWRSGDDQIPGTSDDRLFQSLGNDDEGIRSSALNSEEAAVLAFLVGAKRLTVEPRFFQLVSRGWGEGYKGICEIRVVLEKQKYGAPRILEWTETWLN